MEASVAANGQGDAGQGDGQEAAQQYATVDQFNELQGAQQEMLQFLRQQAPQAPQEQQQPEEPAEPGLDLSFLDDGYTDPGVAQQLAGALEPLQQQTRQALEAAQAAREATQELRYEREADALAAEMPEFTDEAYQQKIFGLTHELVQRNGWPESALHDPGMWRLVALAQKAAEAANNEGSEQPPAAHLEGGGGATPASAQVDRARQIAEAGGGADRILPFG